MWDIKKHGPSYVAQHIYLPRSGKGSVIKNPKLLHICRDSRGGKQFGQKDKKKNRKTASTLATNTTLSGGGSGADGAGRGGGALGGAVEGVQEARGEEGRQKEILTKPRYTHKSPDTTCLLPPCIL